MKHAAVNWSITVVVFSEDGMALKAVIANDGFLVTGVKYYGNHKNVEPTFMCIRTLLSDPAHHEFLYINA